MSEQTKYSVHLLCGDCGGKLNNSSEMTEDELCQRWIRLVISSGFDAGKCSNGCGSTWSDLNINTKMEIFNVTENKYVDIDKLFMVK